MAQSPLKIVVLISGTGSNLQSLIDHINDGKINARIMAVISNKAEAAGLQRAREHGIQAVSVVAQTDESREAYDQRLAEETRKFDPDLIVCAGFMRIFSDSFVEQFQGRMLNIHPSLLPKYRGLHTHRRALEAKDKEHGASVHFVTPELDGGPVIMQAMVPVEQGDTEQSLAERVLKEEHKLYPLVIQYYADRRIILDGDTVRFDGEILQSPLIMNQP